MPRSLKLYIIGLVSASAVAFIGTSLNFHVDPNIGIDLGMGPDWAIALGVAFWICIALLTSALPVQMRRGTWLSVSVTQIIGWMNHGGPIVASWLARLAHPAI